MIALSKVSWVETIGATFNIPSLIMGLTFLAMGTSVPDMLSASKYFYFRIFFLFLTW